MKKDKKLPLLPGELSNNIMKRGRLVRAVNRFNKQISVSLKKLIFARSRKPPR